MADKHAAQIRAGQSTGAPLRATRMPDERVQHLRAQLNSGILSAAEQPCAMVLIDEQRNELATLQAIVSRLPTDEVGNPVSPCLDEVWVVCDGHAGWLDPDMYYDVGIWSFRVVCYHKGRDGHEWGLMREDWDEPQWFAGPVYLNREDAEAAEKEKNDG